VTETRTRSRGDVDDCEIVAGIADGRTDALSTAYARHSRAVFELARSVVVQRQLAEEVVQDVFLRLWNEPDRYDAARGSLRAYLLTITYGRSVDLARSEGARRRREEREARLAGRGTPAGPPEAELADAHEVRAAMEQLRAGEREAIALAYFLGYSYREVAAKLGVPEGTIKNRIRKGLARLRDELTTEEPVAAI
jgi:RNA polymerase sigma-70 factor (ECF subfamily)